MKRLLFSILLATMCRVNAAEFYVSPSGDDANSGLTQEAPLRTFEQVLRKVQSLPEEWKSDVVVRVMPGEYFFESTVTVSAEHSSTNHKKLIFRNHGPLGSAVLLGGKKLDRRKWKVHKPGIYYQDLPGVKDVNMIYEDGMKARKARIPNYRHLEDFPAADGDYYISGRVGTTESYLTTKDEDMSKAFLGLLADDMKAGVKHYLVTWGHGSCDWHKWIYQVSKIVPGKNQVFVTEEKPILHQKNKEDKNRYYIEGGLRLLDSNGEFYFDDQKERLYYVPRGDIRNCEVIYATTKTVLRFDKTKNITVEGLTFTCTDVLAKTTSAYTWDDPDAALSVVGSENIVIRRCHFRSIGQTAVDLRSSHKNTIENCLMAYLGQSGIKLYYSDNNVIRNNRIHDIGLRRVYCEGVALHASKNNQVRHLEICNSSRYGITVRGKVQASGVDGFPTTGNVVEYIRISDVNQDSGDTAGLHMARINAEKGESYTNTFNQITVTRSIAQPNITDEWAPTGVYLDHKKMVMNQSMSNIEVKNYDPRYKGYTVKRFKGIYGNADRTSPKQKQIMQNRPWNNESSTKFNCSWEEGFDPKHMEYEKIGLTHEFPAEYRRDWMCGRLNEAPGTWRAGVRDAE